MLMKENVSGYLKNYWKILIYSKFCQEIKDLAPGWETSSETNGVFEKRFCNVEKFRGDLLLYREINLCESRREMLLFFSQI